MKPHRRLSILLAKPRAISNNKNHECCVREPHHQMKQTATNYSCARSGTLWFNRGGANAAPTVQSSRKGIYSS